MPWRRRPVPSTSTWKRAVRRIDGCLWLPLRWQPWIAMEDWNTGGCRAGDIWLVCHGPRVRQTCAGGNGSVIDYQGLAAPSPRGHACGSSATTTHRPPKLTLQASHCGQAVLARRKPNSLPHLVSSEISAKASCERVGLEDGRVSEAAGETGSWPQRTTGAASTIFADMTDAPGQFATRRLHSNCRACAPRTHGRRQVRVYIPVPSVT